MTYANQYIAPTETGAKASELWNRFEFDRNKRIQALQQQWSAYTGDYREVFIDGNDKSVRLNPIRFAINSDVFRMMGMSSEGSPKTIHFDVEGDQNDLSVAFQERLLVTLEQQTPEQRYLNKVWELNQKDLFLQEVFTCSAVYGHVFVKLIPAGLEDLETSERFPRLVLLNPMNVSVFWSSEDLNNVLWYRVYNALTETQFIEDHIAVEDGWVIKSFKRVNGRWETHLPDQFSEVPLIYDWKNLSNPFEYYGSADFSQTVIELNKQAIFVASNIAKIIKHHAHPKTIGIGIAPNQVTATAVDSFWAVPNEKAQIFNLEMRSDLSSSRAFLSMLIEEIYAEMREVNPAMEGKDLDQVTNFAVRVLFFPALHKTAAKRVIVANALSRLCNTILRLGGFSYQKVKVVFPQSLPKDPNADAQALTLDRANGLSQASYLDARGYNSTLEALRRAKEQQVENTPQEIMTDPV